MAQTAEWAVDSAPSGLEMRVLINAILAVLRSGGSGPSAPSPTVGGQFWLDTGVSPAVLRVRNVANTAWLVVNPETIPANTLRGNPTGSAAAEQEVSAAQLMTMLGFGQSLAANGYVQLPGGVIVQWGSATTLSSGELTITLPITYPTAHASVVASHLGTAAVMTNVNSLTTSAFGTRAFNDAGTQIAALIRWISVGY